MMLPKFPITYWVSSNHLTLTCNECNLLLMWLHASIKINLPYNGPALVQCTAAIESCLKYNEVNYYLKKYTNSGIAPLSILILHFYLHILVFTLQKYSNSMHTSACLLFTRDSSLSGSKKQCVFQQTFFLPSLFDQVSRWDSTWILSVQLRGKKIKSTSASGHWSWGLKGQRRTSTAC